MKSKCMVTRRIKIGVSLIRCGEWLGGIENKRKPGEPFLSSQVAVAAHLNHICCSVSAWRPVTKRCLGISMITVVPNAVRIP